MELLNHPPKYKRAMVFGVFDGLHRGHKNFLSQASDICDELTVVVTLSDIVKVLKNQSPKNSYEKRVSDILSFNSNLNVVPGDDTLGAWKVFDTCNPEIIFLGHDQHGIAKELEKLSRPFLFLDAHEPGKYKSSLLRTDE